MKISKVTNDTIFTADWSENDPRSVKAYLSGKGDGRTLWWNLNYRVHKLLQPTAPLERVMYFFHCRHHKHTLRTARYLTHVHKVSSVIRRHGPVAGMRAAISATHDPFQ